MTDSGSRAACLTLPPAVSHCVMPMYKTCKEWYLQDTMAFEKACATSLQGTYATGACPRADAVGYCYYKVPSTPGVPDGPQADVIWTYTSSNPGGCSTFPFCPYP
jgi:hypothetical protein